MGVGLVIAVVLGCALLLVPVGMLLSGHRSRRQFAAMPDTFRCKIRAADTAEGANSRWPRSTSHAVWVHDTLVVVRGRLRTRVEPLPVHFAEGVVDVAAGGDVSGLGGEPVLLSLELDDDRHVVLAAPASARVLVSGPYLVAQLATGVRPGGDNPPHGQG